MLIIRMVLQPVFLRRITLVGNDGTAKIEGIPVLLSTTFGEFTFSSASKPLSTVKGFTRVAIWVAGSSKHALTACNCEGWMKGSSPWIFTTTSNCPPILYKLPDSGRCRFYVRWKSLPPFLRMLLLRLQYAHRP